MEKERKVERNTEQNEMVGGRNDKKRKLSSRNGEKRDREGENNVRWGKRGIERNTDHRWKVIKRRKRRRVIKRGGNDREGNR